MHFLVALGRFIWRALRKNDSPVASPAMLAERREICETCANFEPEKRMCDVCGCYVDLKIVLGSESCPRKKW
jgi:Family of unknown function (DUF6171)